MAPDQDVYRKVGRGGAGNYYSSSKADEASRVNFDLYPFSLLWVPRCIPRWPSIQYPHTDNNSQDLEAQKLDTTPAPPPDSSTTLTSVRAGRGGAGNYVDPANLPNAREQEEMADKTAAAIEASLKRNQNVRGGLGGRGGAGNWHEESEAAHKGEGGAKEEDLERKVKDVVDKGLKLPDKVHHG